MTNLKYQYQSVKAHSLLEINNKINLKLDEITNLIKKIDDLKFTNLPEVNTPDKITLYQHPRDERELVLQYGKLDKIIKINIGFDTPISGWWMSDKKTISRVFDSKIEEKIGEYYQLKHYIKLDNNHSYHKLIRVLFYFDINATYNKENKLEILDYFNEDKKVFEDYFNIAINNKFPLIDLTTQTEDKAKVWKTFKIDNDQTDIIAINYNRKTALRVENYPCGKVRTLQIKNQLITLFTGSYGQVDYYIENL